MIGQPTTAAAMRAALVDRQIARRKGNLSYLERRRG